MYKDGWWLAMKTARIPWVLTPEAIEPYSPGIWNPDDDPTELYYLPDDFSQAHDLAATQPDKVAELRELFWQEAERYKVLPLLAALSAFFGQLPPLPEVAKFEFQGDVQNVLPGMIPRVYNHSYTISADLVVPPERRRRSDRGRSRPSWRLLAVGRQREADPQLLDDGRVHLPPAGAGTDADRRGQRPHGVRRRQRPTCHRRPGHALRQRQARGWRTHGPHGAHPLLRLCRAWTSGATTEASSTGVTSRESRSPSTGRSARSSSTSSRISQPEEAELHAVASRTAAGHALSE